MCSTFWSSRHLNTISAPEYKLPIRAIYSTLC
jgi:hypothetical protein